MESEVAAQGIRDENTLADTLPLVDYEVIESTTYHWSITTYPELPNRMTSPIFQCGGHQWRILFFPFGNNVTDIISLYLECVHEGEEKEWAACAQFALAISNPTDPTIYHHSHATHRFTPEETDWGFTRFIDFGTAGEITAGNKRPLVEDESCVISAHVQVVKDPTGVLWHNFNQYDSKKETGHVGMYNQGATCYMNSLLQSLYFTNYFRKATYQIPTANEEPTKSVALALQRVFYNLQVSDKPVETTELTRSFGWDSIDSFMQHDVQEFNRVLQDNLEAKMKNTPAEGAISKLFVGRMKSYIKCVNVDYESSRTENYYDIQLNVKGCKNLVESFRDYCAEEMLEGDNKYMAEGYGLQDAKKGVIFEEFPPVLHLQLKRFEYDMMRDTMVKINDRHEFPLEIDLEEFLSPDADHSQPSVYKLHGVLVHSGDLSGGHYFALLRPEKDGRWFKFDDDRVVPVTEREVLEDNYGGEPYYPTRTKNGRQVANPGRPPKLTTRYTNAYMLVYIRESAVDEILAPVTQADIPSHLNRRIEEETRINEQRRLEDLERQLTIETRLVTDETVRTHKGFDLANFVDPAPGESSPISLRVKREMSTAEYKNLVAEKLQLKPDSFQLWIMISRQNKTIRPDFLLRQSTGVTLQHVKDTKVPKGTLLRFYVERLDVTKGTTVSQEGGVVGKLSGITNESHFLMHLKYFDVMTGTMTCLGPLYVPRHGLIGDVVPTLVKRAKLPKGTLLKLYEEIKPGLIDEMDFTKAFDDSEMQDGDIICFQQQLTLEQRSKVGEIDTVVKYFENYANNVVVHFYPWRTNSKESGQQPLDTAGDENTTQSATTASTPPPVVLRLHKRTPYDKVAQALAEQLECDAANLLFFGKGPSDAAARMVERSPTMTLAEMTRTWDNVPSGRAHTLYYEVLAYNATEFQSKRKLEIVWQNAEISEQRPVEVRVSDDSTVADVLEEFRKVLETSGFRGSLSTPVRLYYGAKHVPLGILEETDLVSTIPTDATLYTDHLLASSSDGEEEGEEDVAETHIGVYHYHRDLTNTHGTPFYIKFVPGEPVADTRTRLRSRLGMSERDFAKLKIMVVFTKRDPTARPPVALSTLEESAENVSLSSVGPISQVLLALDCPETTTRSARVNERSIRIFN
ncbi:ubiquitin-specific protease ubp15 [Dispira parvispora]|uniref:ubiquitinyl hydrolase 1 n=1 Tax=Dispira parvispora TaxID=1520584 RepID=A0A9W8E657_9FUNG|nr:ubiquitin-specific protease ubp15 [Dispira parvispora]